MSLFKGQQMSIGILLIPSQSIENGVKCRLRRPCKVLSAVSPVLSPTPTPVKRRLRRPKTSGRWCRGGVAAVAAESRCDRAREGAFADGHRGA